MTNEERDEPLVRVTLPRSHWDQIESDIMNMCGTGDASEIEILASAEVEEVQP